MKTQNFITKIFIGCCLVCSLFALPGCQGGEDQDLKKDVVIRMLYSDWPSDLIAYLAQEKGFFDKYDVNVELVKVSGYEELKEKKQDKEISYIWTFTLLDFLTEIATGAEPDGQVILMEDYSYGADAVLTLPKYDIDTIEDLKGRKVGVAKGTVSEFFLQILLQRKDLELSDLEIIDVESEGIPMALEKGEIEVGVAYEPDVSASIQNGSIVLADSKQERGVIVDVYVAKKSHINANTEEYEKFLAAIFDAVKFFEENPEESYEIMKEPFDMSTEELQDTFDKLKIATLRENQTAFDRISGFQSLFSLGKQAEQYLEAQGIIGNSINFDPLFDIDLINGASKKMK